MSSDDITEWIASHPKLLHVLFVGLVVLTQVGIVIAENGGGGVDGP